MRSEIVKTLIYLMSVLPLYKRLSAICYFHSDDHDDVSQQRAIGLFKRKMNETDFTIMIKRSTEFLLTVDFIPHDLSFRQVEDILDSLHKR